MKREYFYDIEQGSVDWYNLRLGIVTASHFKDVLNKKTGRMTYMMSKVAERQQEASRETFQSDAMKMGVENEQFARKYYEDWSQREVKLVGFVKMGGLGSSPDGLVNEDGIIEIKCSEGPTHYRLILKAEKNGVKEMPSVYVPQVQGNLWITERKWCDFISYDPKGINTPFYCARVIRDDNYINDILKSACEKFLQELNDMDEIITGAKI